MLTGAHNCIAEQRIRKVQAEAHAFSLNPAMMFAARVISALNPVTLSTVMVLLHHLGDIRDGFPPHPIGNDTCTVEVPQYIEGLGGRTKVHGPERFTGAV
jgi:hypothetical protein